MKKFGNIAIALMFVLWTWAGTSAEEGATGMMRIDLRQRMGASELDNGGESSLKVHGLLCMRCHALDSSQTNELGDHESVLWNREETRAVFNMYVTMAGNQGDLDGPSKLCLSCHDGVTAPDNYGGRADGSSLRMNMAGLGGSLADDHPIGIEYPRRDRRGAPLKGYLYPPRGNVRLVKVRGVARVECTSCHDPHGSIYGKLLRESRMGSALCFNCHDK